MKAIKLIWLLCAGVFLSHLSQVPAVAQTSVNMFIRNTSGHPDTIIPVRDANADYPNYMIRNLGGTALGETVPVLYGELGKSLLINLEYRNLIVL